MPALTENHMVLDNHCDREAAPEPTPGDDFDERYERKLLELVSDDIDDLANVVKALCFVSDYTHKLPPFLANVLAPHLRRARRWNEKCATSAMGGSDRRAAI